MLCGSITSQELCALLPSGEGREARLAGTRHLPHANGSGLVRVPEGHFEPCPSAPQS